MADLGKLLFPRLPPRAEHAAKVVYDVAMGPSGLGAGVEGAGPTLDPVSDAVAQLAVINAYFAVVSAGGNPTASQFAAAQNALGALGADLRALQLQPSPPPGSKMWVSGPAAIGVAGVSALVGGVVGWLAKGSSTKGGSGR
jgi:hypothetical protein